MQRKHKYTLQRYKLGFHYFRLLIAMVNTIPVIIACILQTLSEILICVKYYKINLPQFINTSIMK